MHPADTDRGFNDRGFNRRDFLKLSAGSAALLSVGALTAGLSGCVHDAPPAAGFTFLRPADLKLFAALIPVVLAATLPAEERDAHVTAILQGIDGAIVRLQPANQKAVRQLFDLLDGGLTRWLATGVRQSWEQADADSVTAFLTRWKTSSIGLFNAGYRALSKLIVGTWFSTDAGVHQTGYPGPWKPMFDAINAPAA